MQPRANQKPIKKELSIKDKLYLDNLIKHKGNQLRAYMETYPDSSLESAECNAYRKTNQIGNERVLSAISEVTEAWIVDKLKLFVDKAPKYSDKIRSTELLGKWKALFTDKSQVSMQQSLTIEDIKAVAQYELNKERLDLSTL